MNRINIGTEFTYRGVPHRVVDFEIGMHWSVHNVRAIPSKYYRNTRDVSPLEIDVTVQTVRKNLITKKGKRKLIGKGKLSKEVA